VKTNSPFEPRTTTGRRITIAIAMGLVLLPLSLAGPACWADDQPTLADAVKARGTGAQSSPKADGAGGGNVADPVDLAREWGIEVTSIRLTANDHMIDFRYRVVDAAKAEELFVRHNKPRLIHQESGRVLSVPETAKVGPLRNSNAPQEGKIYWMFFGNAGNLVKAGDPVTVAIGDFQAEDLVVE
jgi:hypothetical protein